MPVPLRYSGAHTHRLSGDWLVNMQNLPSGRGKGQTNKLRRSLVAPHGKVVVVADKAQIECRINAYICREQNLLDMFRNGQDAYSVLATNIFERPVDKQTDNGIPRFIGKGGELGLGFGCGHEKFYNMVVRQARSLGMDVKELIKFWSKTLARKAVHTYRKTHPNIVSSWQILQKYLDTAWLGQTAPTRFGPVIIGHNSRFRDGFAYVEGPSGLKMKYGNPRRDPDTGELWYDYEGRPHRMYGPKFLENIVQFLARINTMHDALRIQDRIGHSFALQSHDELVWVVPNNEAQSVLDIALEEMKRPPSWMPDIPLDAEGSIGQSYGECK
ncbi:MAG TPA: DNA polymerase [Ktedonobacteraceae bacterium]|nr:DNA polymerase [Ktedonobacteraceae bacterium]